MLSGLFHINYLDRSIFNRRVVRLVSFYNYHILWKTSVLNANSVDRDRMPLSDLGLYCLPVSLFGTPGINGLIMSILDWSSEQRFTASMQTLNEAVAITNYPEEGIFWRNRTGEKQKIVDSVWSSLFMKNNENCNIFIFTTACLKAVWGRNTSHGTSL